jgi:glycosyltransferase involved in cell wall biosynthesis
MSKIKVLQFSPHDEDCGVGKYQEQFVSILKKDDEIETKFFDSSPYKTRVMSRGEREEVMSRLRQELKHYDVLHIQHEFGLFRGDEFKQMVDIAKNLGKRVIVTIHTSPDLAFNFKRPGGLGPRSILHMVRQKRPYEAFKTNHITPLSRCDLLIVHNELTKSSLLRNGVSDEHIVLFTHPVPDQTESEPSTEIAENLRKKEGDIVYCTVGFISRNKGVRDAVKALRYLPDNYKLAIIGGLHPASDDVAFYAEIADLIDQLNLRDRVYITGFIKDDKQLNSLIRECDVCVYPYDGVYYASVSSGSLNLAFANERPVIAYPTASFREANAYGQITLCQTFAYYELARELRKIDVKRQTELVNKYVETFNWSKMTAALKSLYKSV